MAAINADPEVMRFFPATQTEEQTQSFIDRARKQYEAKSFTYFAADRLDTGTFIGFIGLSEQTYDADFTPCIDIGWRLAKEHWHHGFATEGAKRCLEYAFQDLKLSQVVATAPAINLPSIHVITKIGMSLVKHFKHPMLKGDEQLEDCVLYAVNSRDVVHNVSR
ncbi:N-acetyltransferase [Taibaiella soli]|uniref:N-acetyltransferase n=2 Tax=Taibaiella soli TaxID=1649169 RepID=A0A2W2ADT2_9BACT|nr:N-acetyltransferase [Taibaiella soli]